MKRASKSETILMQRIKEGEEYAFEIMFLKYREPLCRYVWKFVRSSAIAEEIVQDVFTDIWFGKENLNTNGHLRGFIFEVARNKALDQLKHQKIIEKHIFETIEIISEKNITEQISIFNLEDDNISRVIKKSINDLPEKGRQVFELNRIEGLTYLEISEYLDISVKTVETHMRRAFQTLRVSIGKHLHRSLSAK